MLRSTRVSALLKRSAPWEVGFAIRLLIETCFSFDPNELALADVHSENAQLVKRLRTAISLETMKQALEDKDTKLAEAWKNANAKTKAAEDSLKVVSDLKEENKTLKAATEVMKGEVSELKKSYVEWDQKFKSQASDFEGEKKKLTYQVTELLKKKAELEQYIEDFGEEISKKLEGMPSWLSDSCLIRGLWRCLIFCLFVCIDLCADAELETERIERELNPSRLLHRDSAALVIL